MKKILAFFLISSAAIWFLVFGVSLWWLFLAIPFTCSSYICALCASAGRAVREYMIKDGRIQIRECDGEWMDLVEHMKQKHPEEYRKYILREGDET